MSSPSFLPLLLLSIVAPIGAFDVLYFHLYRFRLHARRESRLETITHVIRGVLIGIVALVLARYEARGAWFVALAGVVLLDFANNLLDVWLEESSRRALGGVPRLEYLIHVVGSTIGGAACAALLVQGHDLASLPTALVPSEALPRWLAANGTLIGVGSLAIAALESVLLIRAAARDTSAPRAIATA